MARHWRSTDTYTLVVQEVYRDLAQLPLFFAPSPVCNLYYESTAAASRDWPKHTASNPALSAFGAKAIFAIMFRRSESPARGPGLSVDVKTQS
jgi:hypothetical protein